MCLHSGVTAVRAQIYHSSPPLLVVLYYFTDALRSAYKVHKAAPRTQRFTYDTEASPARRYSLSSYVASIYLVYSTFEVKVPWTGCCALRCGQGGAHSPEAGPCVLRLFSCGKSLESL